MTKPLALALGDPAGIGPEIAAKAWERRRQEGLAPFFAVGLPDALAAVWDGPIRTISDPDEAISAFDDALPVNRVAGGGAIIPGQPTL